MKLQRPTSSAAEMFRGMLEKTSSPYVYMGQLQQRIDTEVRNARGRASQYNENADHLEPQIAGHLKDAEGWAKLLAESGQTDDNAELERSAANRRAANSGNDMRAYRAAASEWTMLADGLEAELTAFKAKLSAAQAEVGLQA